MEKQIELPLEMKSPDKQFIFVASGSNVYDVSKDFYEGDLKEEMGVLARDKRDLVVEVNGKYYELGDLEKNGIDDYNIDWLDKSKSNCKVGDVTTPLRVVDFRRVLNAFPELENNTADGILEARDSRRHIYQGKLHDDDFTYTILKEVEKRENYSNFDMVGEIRAIMNYKKDSAIIGYWIRPKYEGQGIGTAAVKAFTGELFSLGLKEVSANIEGNNEPSARVLAKAGFGEPKILRGQYSQPIGTEYTKTPNSNAERAL